MADKKYELVKDDTIKASGKTLYRIKALKSFTRKNGGSVKSGELGGYIESEENLSQDGTCWVADDAIVYGKAKVIQDAIIYDSVMVYGEASVYENARITDDVKIYGKAKVHGDSRLENSAEIFGNADVDGDANIGQDAKVYGNAKITFAAEIFGTAEVCGNSVVKNALIQDGKHDDFDDQ